LTNHTENKPEGEPTIWPEIFNMKLDRGYPVERFDGLGLHDAPKHAMLSIGKIDISNSTLNNFRMTSTVPKDHTSQGLLFTRMSKPQDAVTPHGGNLRTMHCPSQGPA